MAHETPPQWDRETRRRLRHGEAAALGELYDRFAPLAYGIARRVLDEDPAAADVTAEVFGRLWASPDSFDPARGPLRSWIATESHRLAVERLRDAGTADRPGHPPGTAPTPATAAELAHRVRAASTAARADYIVTSMPAPLRDALELTRAQRQDYRHVARRLGITEEETRRRLRLGLQLLSTAGSYAAPEGA
ncbi:sigma-70 family RNA polymerase sigma factor [Streptomyces sp. SM14]|uniref:sigma-70 family RNA polymerase sigma factor n=1 Tax=Streptomyces sp. SM14 TaxID=1736045 RepID=UPI000CD57E25|nr:sigma-70 family RNA polymerase sigma factor [Streptomyces sp. SM14]